MRSAFCARPPFYRLSEWREGRVGLRGSGLCAPRRAAVRSKTIGTCEMTRARMWCVLRSIYAAGWCSCCPSFSAVMTAACGALGSPACGSVGHPDSQGTAAGIFCSFLQSRENSSLKRLCFLSLHPYPLTRCSIFLPCCVNAGQVSHMRRVPPLQPGRPTSPHSLCWLYFWLF